MDNQASLDTHHKALNINLEPSIFGSFAEIGAGQEVARWFLQVGGASGTVAKTISAYDKEVSDDIYGVGSRYVSIERLRAMLDKEWRELLVQLQQSRGAKTRFFSFVDTVVARNYAGTNLPHGWMGLRFQEHPEAPPNDIILHMNLSDPTNLQQQEAIGILGVNLVHAAFYEKNSAEEFLKGLAQLVAPGRIEIDFIELRGPVFDGANADEWNSREIHVRLVAHHFAEAVIFTQDKSFLPFVDALHKKAVVLAPGFFQQPSDYHRAMMQAAVQTMEQELGCEMDAVLGLFCVSLPPLLPELPNPDFSELRHKIQALQDLGYGVLFVHERELYKISAVVQRYTALPIRFVIGISVLLRVFEDEYHHLGGSTLRAISLLFSQNVRIYASPMSTRAVQDRINKLNATGWQWTDTDGTVFAESLKPPGALRLLYEYLLASNFVVPIRPAQPNPVPAERAAAE